MSSFGYGVLLEGSVNGVPGERNIPTQRFIVILAIFTGQATSVHPFDTSAITKFKILGGIAASDDSTGTFVATDKGKFPLYRPVTTVGMKIGVAYSRICNFHKELIRSGLGDRDLLVYQFTTVFLENLSPLLLRNVRKCIEASVGCEVKRTPI